MTGAWVVLGKMKASGKAPRNPLLSGHGFGAVELSARYDVLTFYSAPGPGLPSRSPRAPAILPNSERTWTVGPTWYLNRFIKIQINGQRCWTLFDTGARNTYVTKKVARSLTKAKLEKPLRSALGGSTKSIRWGMRLRARSGISVRATSRFREQRDTGVLPGAGAEVWWWK